MAKNQSSSSSHALVDTDVLECPFCCELLKIPIFQCENGHLACSPCCEKVKKMCPSCKSPIGSSRCRAMERVIGATRVSCPNEKFGCKENTSFENRSSHEKQCLFAPCSCPFSLCNYIGSDKDLYNHFLSKHRANVTQIVWDTPSKISLDWWKKIAIFQEEKDRELFVVQAFWRSDCMAISVSCIAPFAPRLGGIFSCCLKLVTNNTKLNQTFKVRQIQKVSDEEPKDGFMLIPYHMLMPPCLSFYFQFCLSCCPDTISFT